MFWKREESLNWSEKPGPTEMHLKRRYNNPLFQLYRQTISSKELKEAIKDDDFYKKNLLQDLAAVINKVKAFAGEDESGNQLFDVVRTELSSIMDKSIELGDIANDVLEVSESLFMSLIDVRRKSLNGHQEALNALDEAVDYHLNVSLKSKTTTGLQLQGNYIPDDEVLPTIVSEPLDSLILILAGMDGDGPLVVAENGIDLLADLNDSKSKLVSDYKAKISYFETLIKTSQ